MGVGTSTDSTVYTVDSSAEREFDHFAEVLSAEYHRQRLAALRLSTKGDIGIENNDYSPAVVENKALALEDTGKSQTFTQLRLERDGSTCDGQVVEQHHQQRGSPPPPRKERRMFSRQLRRSSIVAVTSVRQGNGGGGEEISQNSFRGAVPTEYRASGDDRALPAPAACVAAEQVNQVIERRQMAELARDHG